MPLGGPGGTGGENPGDAGNGIFFTATGRETPTSKAATFRGRHTVTGPTSSPAFFGDEDLAGVITSLTTCFGDGDRAGDRAGVPSGLATFFGDEDCAGVPSSRLVTFL